MKVLTISTLLMKLIWAALPIKLSKFLNKPIITAQECKSWHSTWWFLPCTSTASHRSSRNIQLPFSHSSGSQAKIIRVFGCGQNSKAHRDPDAKPGEQSFWTTLAQASVIAYRGKFPLSFHCLAWSTAELRCISSWRSLAKAQHLLA